MRPKPSVRGGKPWRPEDQEAQDRFHALQKRMEEGEDWEAGWQELLAINDKYDQNNRIQGNWDVLKADYLAVLKAMGMHPGVRLGVYLEESWPGGSWGYFDPLDKAQWASQNPMVPLWADSADPETMEAIRRQAIFTIHAIVVQSIAGKPSMSEENKARIEEQWGSFVSVDHGIPVPPRLIWRQDGILWKMHTTSVSIVSVAISSNKSSGYLRLSASIPALEKIFGIKRPYVLSSLFQSGPEASDEP